MTDQSPKSRPTTLPDMSSAISSPASGDGPSRSAGQDGPTTDPCGPEAAPASRSAFRDKDELTGTSDTLPLFGSTSSPSAALQQSLESRLRARMGVRGSVLYGLSWKAWDMLQGQPICALRASGRRTSASGSILALSGLEPIGPRWPLEWDQELQGWATSRSEDAESSGMRHGRGVADTLTAQATHLSGWPTAQAGSKATETYNEAGNTDSGRQTVALSGWPTPTKGNAEGSQNMTGMTSVGKRADGSKGTVSLPGVAKLSGWPTSRANDGTGPQQPPNRQGGEILKQTAQLSGPARITPDGKMLTGSTARMESGGQLNPHHSRWIMGYPRAWCDCAVTATPSSRNSRRSL